MIYSASKRALVCHKDSVRERKNGRICARFNLNAGAFPNGY
jgi:hypothetical protein